MGRKASVREALGVGFRLCGCVAYCGGTGKKGTKGATAPPIRNIHRDCGKCAQRTMHLLRESAIDLCKSRWEGVRGDVSIRTRLGRG